MSHSVVFFGLNCFFPFFSDSAYTLYDRDFLNNCASVLLYAVVGTLINVFAIGYGLYGLYYVGAMGSFRIVAANGTEQVSYGAIHPLVRDVSLLN